MADAIERRLADEAETDRLGGDLAAILGPGDAIALSGDLGAGKTSLARSIIRALAADPDLDVPSPTFTLMQLYETRLRVAHLDLYRLSSPDELIELGVDEVLEDGLALIEWPDRAGDLLPSNAIRIELDIEGAGRVARIDGPEAKLTRIRRSLEMRDFLIRSGWGSATRRPLGGDASARAYEIIERPNGDHCLLMNSPPLVLGPAVKSGKAYAEIAHTSRTVAAFIGVDHALAEAGVTVPTILAQDIGAGVLLIENLGSEGVLDSVGRPIAERYLAAAELLAFLHARPWTARVPVTGDVWHDIPPFDRGAMLIEVELLLDWYAPWVTGQPASQALRDAFSAEWNALIDRLEHADIGLVQRDYHSPNLIWRDDRRDHDRLGVLDFQDALIGPVAYDLASLAMDARVTVPAELERSLLAGYLEARKDQPGFDSYGFEEAYAIMAAQRNSKILGIFVRLDKRDGKPQYLKHLPRIRDYLERSLSHPTLAALAELYRAHGLLDTGPK